jgi:hypothetical protein
MFRREPGPDLIGAGHRFADKEHAQRRIYSHIRHTIPGIAIQFEWKWL